MIVETDRSILREFTLSDLDDFAPIMADPEVMRLRSLGRSAQSRSMPPENVAMSGVAAGPTWPVSIPVRLSAQLIS